MVSYRVLSIDTHFSRSAVVLLLMVVADCGHVHGAVGEAQERSTGRGPLVVQSRLVGSQLPWGT